MDTTTTVLIGVGGIAVGALASGSVQSYLARADRRRAGRSAARLLYMQLHGAAKAVGDLRDARDWELMITDFEAYGASWDKHNEDLAQVLDTKSFQVVAAAFECLGSLANARKRDLAQPQAGLLGPPNFDPEDELLELYEANAKAARSIVLKRSFRWWEKRTRDKAIAGT